VWIKAKRSYYNLSQKNSCKLQWRRKYSTEEWDDSTHKWADLLTATDTSDEYNAMIPNVVFDLKKSYTIQIKAVDDIGEHDTKTFDVPTEDVALHLGKGGKNVSVGGYCDYSEDYTFRSIWKAYFEDGVYIDGERVAKHIVDYGKSGIWSWIKWSDGTAECRGIHTQENVSISTAWGSLFESAGYVVDLPSGLFVETPQFNITLIGTRGTMLEVWSEGSTTQTPHMCAIRPSSQTVERLHTSIVAYGRWK
jgi:hypothetical protein